MGLIVFRCCRRRTSSGHKEDASFLLLQRSPSLSSCVQMLYSSSSAPANLCYAVTEEAPYYLLLFLWFRILKKIQVQKFFEQYREGSLSLVIPFHVFHTALAWPIICRFLLLNFNMHSPWRVRRRFQRFPPNPSSFEIPGMVSYISNPTQNNLTRHLPIYRSCQLSPTPTSVFQAKIWQMPKLYWLFFWWSR